MFKKTRALPTPSTPGAPSSPAPKNAKDRSEPAHTAPPAEPESLWQERLAAAADDDAALLDLARQAPHVAVRCAAITSIRDEALLKQAEREFRGHDRRVHRAAKQALELAVASRQARQRAAELITAATALELEATIPTNRLVELDRDWQTLDATLLEAAQRADYAAASQRLTTLTHQRGEREAAESRWRQAAPPALQAMRRASLALAQGSAEAAELATACAVARELRDTAPSGATNAAVTSLEQALGTALQDASEVQIRVVLLETLALETLAPTHDPEPEPVAALKPESLPARLPEPMHEPDLDPQSETGAVQADAVQAEESSETPVPAAESPAVTVPPSPCALERWQALPPLADAALAEALALRFAQWQASQLDSRRAAQGSKRQTPGGPDQDTRAEKAPAAPKQRPDPGRSRPVLPLDDMLRGAEGALVEGNLADLQQRVAALDGAMAPGTGSAAQRARLQGLHAELARLKGWQQWSGGRARDDLLAEAEQLGAAAAAAVADPDQAGKVPVNVLADTIHGLRQRWKELDRVGGAGKHALWKRFSAALELAYQPVAAHQAILKSRRDENLLAREQLLASLEALLPPPISEGEAAPPALDWKERAHALDQFQHAWRKLGPLEHTVPHQARHSLAERLRQTVEHIEAPLKQARRNAQTARESLIARATALADDAQVRDRMAHLRDLQQQWQQQARALPLARAAENALWEQFKTACDAVVAQRDAVHKARDAERSGNLANRAALLEKLESLGHHTPITQIRRALADVDAQWQHTAELPRAQIAALEARHRSARGAAQRLLDGYQLRIWQARCDALLARLAQGEIPDRAADADEAQSTNGTGSAPDAGAARRALTPATDAPALPDPWLRGLEARRNKLGRPEGDAAPKALAERDVDTILLRLEAALDLPSPQAFEQARRELKLHAMKAALERGQAQDCWPNDPIELVGSALACLPADGPARERFARAFDHIRSTLPR